MNDFHQYDPFDAIQQLGQRAELAEHYILEITQMMEEIAKNGRHQAHHQEQSDQLLRHVFKLLQYQHNLIIKLNDRLENLEKK